MKQNFRDLHPDSFLIGEMVGSGVVLTLFLPLIIFAGRAAGVRAIYPGAIWLLSTGVGIAFHHTASPLYHSPNDSNGYQVWAYQILDGETGIRSAADLLATKLLWPSVIASIYNIFGQAQLAIILLNSALLALTMVVCVKVTSLFVQRPPVRITTLFFALNPPLLFFASALGRESAFLFFLSVLILGAALILRSRTNWGILSLTFGAIGAALVRPNLGFLTVLSLGTLGGIALIFSGHRSGRRTHWLAGISLSLACALSYAPFANFVLPDDLAAVAQTRQELDTGSTAFEEPSTAFEEPSTAPSKAEPVASNFGFLTTLFVSFLRASLGPFPWEWTPTLMGVFYSSSAIFWFAVLIGALSSLKISAIRPLTFIFVLVAGLQVGAISVETSNYGLLMRVRLSAFVTLLPIAITGLTIILEEMSNSKAASWLRRKFLS